MFWRHRVEAILGVLFAVAIISGAVVWSFVRVNERTVWTDFVQDSSETIVEATELMEDAKKTVKDAKSVEIRRDLVFGLAKQIELTKDAIAEAEGLSQFIVAKETEDAVGGNSQSENPWADLDPMSTLKSASVDMVVYPDGGRKVVSHFHDVMFSVDRALESLRVTEGKVVKAMEVSLRKAFHSWESALGELTDLNVSAFTTLQEVTSQGIFENTKLALWEAYKSGRSTQIQAENTEPNDVIALTESTDAIKEELKRMRQMFGPYLGETETQENSESSSGLDGAF